MPAEDPKIRVGEGAQMNNRPFEDLKIFFCFWYCQNLGVGWYNIPTLFVPPALRTGVEGRVAHMLSHGRKNSSTQAQS